MYLSHQACCIQELNMPAPHMYAQSRRLDIRMRLQRPAKAQTATSSQLQQVSAPPTQQPRSVHVHMLNSTLTATQRTLSCLLENHQTPEGVRIPEPLRPFMMGRDFLPFKPQGAATALLKTLNRLPK